MSLVINELSFKNYCKDFYDAERALKAFLCILTELHTKYSIRIQDIYGQRICKYDCIAAGLPYCKFFNQINDRDSLTLLKSLLMNTADFSYHGQEICIDSREAYGATYAYENEGVMLSLPSNVLFEAANVTGIKGNMNVDIRNIANVSQILANANNIVVRIYMASEKHGRKRYKRRGGKDVADMTLSNSEAQRLLNQVVEYKGKLYAEKEGEFYEFMRSMGAYFHGFRRTDLTEDEKKGILKKMDGKKS